MFHIQNSWCKIYEKMFIQSILKILHKHIVSYYKNIWGWLVYFKNRYTFFTALEYSSATCLDYGEGPRVSKKFYSFINYSKKIRTAWGEDKHICGLVSHSVSCNQFVSSRAVLLLLGGFSFHWGAVHPWPDYVLWGPSF